MEVDTHKRVIVGVNDYEDDEPPAIPILEMDPQGHARQVARLNQLRLERDNEKVGQTLNALRAACEGTENTMPYLIDAAKAYATLGEITDVMREVFGVYEETVQI
jgi:methylmalonyl-CoA mutase N-terminal domain/subunit